MTPMSFTTTPKSAATAATGSGSNNTDTDQAVCQRLAKLPDRVLLRAFDKPLERELAALTYLEKTGLAVWWFHPEEWKTTLPKETKLAFIRYLLGNSATQPHIAKLLRRKLAKVGKSLCGYSAIKTACQRIRLRKRSSPKQQTSDQSDNTSLGSSSNDVVIEEGDVWKMMEGDVWKFLSTSWDGTTETSSSNTDEENAPVTKERTKKRNKSWRMKKEATKPLNSQDNQSTTTHETPQPTTSESEEWVILETDFWKLLLNAWDDSTTTSNKEEGDKENTCTNEQSPVEQDDDGDDGWKLFQGDIWQSLLPSWETEESTVETPTQSLDTKSVTKRNAKKKVAR